MFRKKQTWIDVEVDRVVAVLSTHEVLSEDWRRCVEELKVLNEMKYSAPSANTDTLVVAGTNLLGILMVIKHEAVNVVTSKAMNLILKPIIRS